MDNLLAVTTSVDLDLSRPRVAPDVSGDVVGGRHLGAVSAVRQYAEKFT